MQLFFRLRFWRRRFVKWAPQHFCFGNLIVDIYSTVRRMVFFLSRRIGTRRWSRTDTSGTTRQRTIDKFDRKFNDAALVGEFDGFSQQIEQYLEIQAKASANQHKVKLRTCCNLRLSMCIYSGNKMSYSARSVAFISILCNTLLNVFWRLDLGLE